MQQAWAEDSFATWTGTFIATFGWHDSFLSPAKQKQAPKNKRKKKKRESTSGTLGNKIPIDNPWLYGTKKLKEKQPIW